MDGDHYFVNWFDISDAFYQFQCVVETKLKENGSRITRTSYPCIIIGKANAIPRKYQALYSEWDASSNGRWSANSIPHQQKLDAAWPFIQGISTVWHTVHYMRLTVCKIVHFGDVRKGRIDQDKATSHLFVLKKDLPHSDLTCSKFEKRLRTFHTQGH